MNSFPIAGILLVAVFVVGILLSAGRASRKGEKFIGTDDPIQRYEERMGDNLAGRWWKAPGRSCWE